MIFSDSLLSSNKIYIYISYLRIILVHFVGFFFFITVSPFLTKKYVSYFCLFSGAVVMARWRDGFYYPGKISSMDKIKKFVFSFK